MTTRNRVLPVAASIPPREWVRPIAVATRPQTRTTPAEATKPLLEAVAHPFGSVAASPSPPSLAHDAREDGPREPERDGETDLQIAGENGRG